jgi:hypothetical protein
MGINKEVKSVRIQSILVKMKNGYRPILCFIDETREYLLGKLRKGQTVDGEEGAKFFCEQMANFSIGKPFLVPWKKDLISLLPRREEILYSIRGNGINRGNVNPMNTTAQFTSPSGGTTHAGL